MQKKKLIAVLLLVAMLFTLVSATAMAGTISPATELTAQQVLLWNEDFSVPVVASGSEFQHNHINYI